MSERLRFWLLLVLLAVSIVLLLGGQMLVGRLAS